MPRWVFIVPTMLILVSTLIQPSFAQTTRTKNISPAADLYDLERFSGHRVYVLNVNDTSTLLYVGWNSTLNGPLTSFIRFDLHSFKNPNPIYDAIYNVFNTVTHTAVLKLLGRGPIEQNGMRNHYIITATSVDCRDPNWNENVRTSILVPANCSSTIADNSTASSIMIPDSSLPNFYEWTVTSAVEDALPNGTITFRITGYPIDAKNFNGGVTFWSKEASSYISNNYYAGPTDTLIITSATVPSNFANILSTGGAAAVIFGAIYGIARWIKEKR